MRGCLVPQNTHRCCCQCAYALQSCGTDANNVGGLAHPFEVPRKMAESGSSLCTMTPLRASVVPSLHLFSRWRAARGALSSNTSITRRPARHTGLSEDACQWRVAHRSMQERLRPRNTPRSSVPCRISRKTCRLFMSRSGSAGKLSALLPSKAGCLPVLLKTSISFFISLPVGNLLTLPCLTSFASPTNRVILAIIRGLTCDTSTMQIAH